MLSLCAVLAVVVGAEHERLNWNEAMDNHWIISEGVQAAATARRAQAHAEKQSGDY